MGSPSPIHCDGGIRAMPPRQAQHHRQTVDRAEEVARAHLGEPSLIALICEAAGVSQRTLSRAFRTMKGMTPSRYLHELRLKEARKALLSAGAPNESVTEIALRFGFRELGRFAV